MRRDRHELLACSLCPGSLNPMAGPGSLRGTGAIDPSASQHRSQGSVTGSFTLSGRFILWRLACFVHKQACQAAQTLGSQAKTHCRAHCQRLAIPLRGSLLNSALRRVARIQSSRFRWAEPSPGKLSRWQSAGPRQPPSPAREPASRGVAPRLGGCSA